MLLVRTGARSPEVFEPGTVDDITAVYVSQLANERVDVIVGEHSLLLQLSQHPQSSALVRGTGQTVDIGNGLRVLRREGVGDPLEYCPQGGCRVRGKLRMIHRHGSYMQTAQHMHKFNHASRFHVEGCGFKVQIQIKKYIEPCLLNFELPLLLLPVLNCCSFWSLLFIVTLLFCMHAERY